MQRAIVGNFDSHRHMIMRGGRLLQVRLSYRRTYRQWLRLSSRYPRSRNYWIIPPSGIGATAGPLLLPLRAHMEGKADRMSARAYADAPADYCAGPGRCAGNTWFSPDADVQGAAENHPRKHNAATGVPKGGSASPISDRSWRVLRRNSAIRRFSDHEPDHDWTARFFDCVQDVSSGHMQKLWAKVLSGEVENPGRTSLRTLGHAKEHDQNGTPKLFERLAGFVIDGEFYLSRCFCRRTPSGYQIW